MNKMGAGVPAPHRCFNLRNPFARALVLAITLLAFGGLMLRSHDLSVSANMIKSATSAKQSFAAQHPLNGQGHGHVTGSHLNASIHSGSPVMTCDYDMDRIRGWQEKYKLQKKLEYTKRYVRFSRQDIKRKPLTKLAQNLMSGKRKVVNVQKSYPADECPAPLEVPVTNSPFPSQANASDFIFGVSTTYKRFTDPATSSINEWTYWLTDSHGSSNGGKLILMLLDASNDEVKDAGDRLAAAGIDASVYQSDASLEMAVRYLTLVPSLYNHPARAGRKWIVTCDDDTFFPSFNALAERLDEYDAARPLYVGTFSEDVNNIDRHGSQAFGGAGVFLSVPLAKTIADNYAACKADERIREADSGWGPQGDILLRKCIYDHSDTKLTLLNDLWQLDLTGDPSGFYESGIKPLSLHHYRGGGWHVAHPWHYTKIAQTCGEDCTLQRFQTEDGFVISNGFSVAEYPHGIDVDLHQFERTFAPMPDDKGWNLDFKMGPQRAALHRTGRKWSWDLQESTVGADGAVSQVYVRRGDDARWTKPNGAAMSKRDGIIELVWIP